jgi:haloalkane dehalogenase
MTDRSPIKVSMREVLDTTMAFREAGEATAPLVLFLHGNPTSSYIWRNIIPLVGSVGHCIAPDLVGFGQSGRPNLDYRFADHVRYLDAFVDSLGARSAYLVAQDWGTALAFHLAARRPDFVRGLAFMEFIRPWATWEDFHQSAVAREAFRKFRTPGVGEQMVLKANAFVERLPVSIVRKLADHELAAYRAPFPTAESRKPVLALPRELPIAGVPSDVYAMLETAHGALRTAQYPKLLFNGEPGALVSPAFAREFAASLQHCSVVHLGPGLHHLQEDHPDAIGRALTGWIAGIEATRAISALPAAA